MWERIKSVEMKGLKNGEGVGKDEVTVEMIEHRGGKWYILSGNCVT